MFNDDKTADTPSRRIAAEMSDEQDTDKLLRLAKQLSQAMENEAREKVRKRLGLDNMPDSDAA